MSKNEYFNLNGYRPTHRNKWWFISSGTLNIQQLTLLEYYADIMGFDHRNKYCGLVFVDFKKIATTFNKSENSIRGWHKKLQGIGLVKKTKDKNIFLLSCYERYISPGRWQGKASYYVTTEKNQPPEVMLQNFGINLQLVGRKIQLLGNKSCRNLKAEVPIAINSSNIKSNFTSATQRTRTSQEYQRIYEEGCFRLLLPDDMRWIDENVGFRIIKPQTLEDKVVNIFFNNNRDLFERCVVHE